MKKIFGYILLVIAFFGFYGFINYLIFEFRDYGDEGLGSFAIWITGWIGLIIGLISLVIGFSLIKSKRKEKV